MDLSFLDTRAAAETGITVELVHPVTGDPILDTEGQPQWIRAYGADSQQYQKARYAVIDRATERRGRGGVQAPKAAEIEGKAREILARAVSDWQIELEGECPECNLLNVRSLFDRFPWIYEQVDAAINDRGALLGNLPKS
ncbi:MAG: hypothetical protein RL885_25095 [Planctomycetota bacterium]